MAAPTYRRVARVQRRAGQGARGRGQAQARADSRSSSPTSTYRPDPAGSACPVTSHLRRANPRDMLDPQFRLADPKGAGDGSALVNRRRILRRGLPYGEVDRPRRATVASTASSSSRSAPACSASSSSSSSNGCNMGSTSTPAATPVRSSAITRPRTIAQAGDRRRSRGQGARPFICDRLPAARRAARRRLFLHSQHDRAAG